ncbi:MAG: hypothetical protein WAM97_18045, partial [Acidimicrobiales bacterium]
LATASVEPQGAAGLPGGMLNEAAAATSREVIVVASVDDALAVIGAGHGAVVAPGRPGGSTPPIFGYSPGAGCSAARSLATGSQAWPSESAPRVSSANWSRPGRP